MNSVSTIPHRSVSAAADDPKGIASFGVFTLLIFVFLSYSRLADIFLPSLRIPLVTATLAFIAVTLTGGLARAFTSKPGLWLTAFCLWLIAAVPFSSWPGGSFHMLTDKWFKSFLVFVIVAGALRTVKHCRLAVYTIAVADVTIAIRSLMIGGGSSDQRFALAGTGMLSNPNDLAQLLLLGLPFVLFPAMQKTAGWRKKPMVALSVLGILLIVGRTGSRAGTIVTCALALTMFASLSWRNKVKLLAGTALAVLLITPLVPREQRARIATIFSDNSDVSVEAIGSREDRMTLLRQSIALTFRHPIFGVGPGVFDSAASLDAKSRGEDALWHETHNSYTQVSAEAGLPGFVFYLGTLIVCLRITRSLYTSKAEDRSPDVASMSYCLWLSLVIFSVTTFFSSVAYHLYLPLLAGLTVAFNQAAGANAPRASQAVPAAALNPSFRARSPLPARVSPVGQPLSSTKFEPR
jgi:O-antigen ligase